MPHDTDRAGLRVLVCGGRDYDDRDAIWRALDALCGDMTDEHPMGTVEVTLVYAGGFDRFALQVDGWAVCNWCQVVEMDLALALASLRPDLVLAFPGADPVLLSRARAAGIQINAVGGGDVG
ncbi:SLOG family protein [Methylobacterium variabile]|uniref:SLOG family protein n=1 Tax=Methylobacterium variabile TaxID=298794 RepID=UPI0006548246|nr:SLOG family protein [Methylobacterium variabile]